MVVLAIIRAFSVGMVERRRMGCVYVEARYRGKKILFAAGLFNRKVNFISHMMSFLLYLSIHYYAAQYCPIQEGRGSTCARKRKRRDS